MTEPENLVLKILVEIRENISTLTERIGTLENKVDALDAKVDRLAARVTALELRLDAIEARLTRQEHRLAELGESVEFMVRQLRVLLSTHDPDRLDKLEQRVAALERAMVSR